LIRADRGLLEGSEQLENGTILSRDGLMRDICPVRPGAEGQVLELRSVKRARVNRASRTNCASACLLHDQRPRFAQPIKRMIEEGPSFGYCMVAYLPKFNKNAIQRISG
jgi:hypothetical protein